MLNDIQNTEENTKYYDRSFIIHQFIQRMNDSKATCSECNRFFYRHIKSRWYSNQESSSVCNDCFMKNQVKTSVEIWEKIYEYKPEECVVCKKRKKEYPEKYYYYYNENIFDSSRPSITGLVQKREDWEIIKKNLDECFGVCLECENIVNQILPCLKYDELKYYIEEQFLSDKITKEDYKNIMEFYRVDYDIKMKEIIDNLSKSLL